MPFVPSSLAPAGAGAPRWYLVRRGEVLVDHAGHPTGAPGDLEGAADTEAVYLGADGSLAWWGLGVLDGTDAPSGTRWAGLMTLGRDSGAESWALAGRAVQLVEWARTSAYCGRCGSGTVAVAGERARRCPACGLLAYPRLAPAVIVLVRRGRQALLARNARFQGRMFSALAGFVEPGETLEQAAHREILEEVGVTVGDLHYVASQPWPFPHSLMVGFTARWAGGELAVDGEEIAEAAWWDPEDVPEIPPPLSIARRLIDDWLSEVRG